LLSINLAMTKRLKVLMSAYACEPGKGSEPEVGWQWALHMARYHDVTVLTRANNQSNIEAGLAKLRNQQPVPRFIYHDRSPGLLKFKRTFKAVQLYYILWQKSAHELVRILQAENRFDLLHHVTFAGFRYPTALWGHGVPVIWGPIGGIESIPMELLPWKHARSLAHEVGRNANNLIQSAPFQVLPKRAAASTLVLVSTPEMQRTLARFGTQADVMPTIGLVPAELPYRERKANHGRMELLFVGSIITLKGVDLALEALAKAGTDARLTFIGSGNYETAARRLAFDLGLADRVTFAGRLPRNRVLELYSDYDVFLFPSLHDTGGYAVIEAMFYELPVICLDCGGPAVAVQPGCGIKVPLGPRADVIESLARAIGTYQKNPLLLREHGTAARKRILETYDWPKKAEQMNAKYEEAVTRRTATTRKYSGMGGMAHVLHQMFSVKGLALTGILLLLVGSLGILSVGHLKGQARRIVEDTLPGLSQAGKANVSLAQGFNRTMLLMITPEPQQRTELQKEIRAYHEATGGHLEAYRKQIFQPEDRALFERWVAAREQYLQIRERALAIAGTNQTEALRLCQHELLPAFERYAKAGDEAFQYNMRAGQLRGERIMIVCTITQWVVAGIGMAVFLLGFSVGFYK
jgi:glycosyltransferase involved in cell wall biosynthesis